MTNRMKATTYIIGAVVVFALAFTLAFMLMPSNAPTAYASTTWNVNHSFNSSMTYNDEIIVTQDVTLTINGCDVTANAGIYVQSGTLTIQGTGTLYVYGKRATGYTYGHGIKGSVVVNGAKLKVYAADGMCDGIQGDLQVTGGDASVEVYGGYGGEPQSSGVGTGGGRGVSGNVTMNGGSLYVEGGSGGDGAYGDGSKKGGSGGAGIGGNVTIRGGGYVHAIGGSGGMGTGGYGSGGQGHYGIVGTLTATSGSAMVVGGEGGEGYNSYGPNAACYGAITGAVRKESSTGGAWTDISEETSTKQYVRVEGHAHHFSYTAEGTSIIATCDAEDCLLPNRQAKITLVAPTGMLMENGHAKAAKISGEIPYVATPAVTYTRDGVAVAASQVTTAGDYVATITLGDATVSVEFTIVPPTYIITIPAKLGVHSGYNATDGISASGVILADQKVVITATSSNGWKLKNSYASIPYYLTATEGGAQKTKWVFYEDELEATTTKPMGAVVEAFDDRIPSGEYTDTVTFKATLESIYTTRDVWNSNDLYNAVAGGAKTFTKDGYTLTCGNAYCSNGMFFITGGGSFTYATGVITAIELSGQTKGEIDPGIAGSLGWVRTGYGYGSSTNSAVWVNWSGEPAQTVPFNNGFRFDPGNYYIRITTIENDR